MNKNINQKSNNNSTYDTNNKSKDFKKDSHSNIIYTNPDKFISKKVTISIGSLIIICIIIFLVVKSFTSIRQLTGVEAIIPSAIYMEEPIEIKLSAIGKGNLYATTYKLKISDNIVNIKDEILNGTEAKTEIYPLKPGRTNLIIETSLSNKKIDKIKKSIVVCNAFNKNTLKTEKNISIKRGETLSLTFDLGNESECYSNLKYKVDNPSIISINKDGVISGNAIGNTKLIVSNGKSSISINIEINSTEKASSISK